MITLYLGMLVSVGGCLLISLAALTTEDLVTDNHLQIWNKKLGSIQGQICTLATNASSSPEDSDDADAAADGITDLIADHRDATQHENQANVLGISFIFMGLFLAGFGSTVYFSLSISYLGTIHILRRGVKKS